MINQIKLSSAITICISIFFLAPVTYANETAKDAQREYNLGHFSRALDIIKPLLTKNDPKAQFLMGKMYSEGSGVFEDDKEAVDWYRKAASQGDATAMAEMSFMYWVGDGVWINKNKAREWLTKAMPQLRDLAEAGDDNAQNAMGWMYDYGVTVPVNTNKAKEWYLKAAQQGNDWATCHLIGSFERKHIEKLADEGMATAHYYLGIKQRGLYKSWYHYNEAAKLGHEKAEVLKWLMDFSVFLVFFLLVVYVRNIRKKAKTIGNDGRNCPVCNKKVSIYSVLKSLSIENKGVQCPHCLSYISSKPDPRNTITLVFLGYVAGREIFSYIDEETSILDVSGMVIGPTILFGTLFTLVTYYTTSFQKPLEK